jgi:2-polyprenyl-3-methyl-5-hydroxy-6-metoxy-1,4-benzoquinol methylase
MHPSESRQVRDEPSAPSAETADIETSSDDYARRFAGPVGAWMLSVQERIVSGWMAERPGAAVLDVGGGHGQLAAPLARRGHRVTVLGSDASCSRRLQPQIAEGHIAFAQGSVVALPFGDRSFDVAISIRLLPHCTRWRDLARELCRVARDAVIVDYPTIQSVNVLSSRLFAMKRKIEGNTRPFALFRHGEVAAAFAENGWRLRRRRAEFFLPMALHRALRMPRLSAGLEAVCRIAGLTRALGSPVLAEMNRGLED